MSLPKSKKKVKSISSLLDELDRPLYEGKWRDIEQILKRTSKKLLVPDAFSVFLRGVEHLDNHMLGQSPADLREAEERLKQTIELCEPGHDAALFQIARIKYGQLLWIRGNYGGALSSLQEGLQCTAADTSLMHPCKVLVEGNLYLGLCLELIYGSSRDGAAVELSQAISAYEESVRLSLTLIHQAKLLSLSRHPAAFKAIKTAVERGPLLSLQLNLPTQAINMYRRVLQSPDEDILQELRQVCSTSLASFLLFHASPSSHASPPTTTLSPSSSPTQLQEEIILTATLSKSFVDTWTISKTNPVPSPAVVFDELIQRGL